MVAACGNVSLRSGAKTSATRKALIPGWNAGPCGFDRGRRLVQRLVRYGRFGLEVVQDRRRQRQVRVVAYGVSYVYAASKLFKAATTYATPPPAGTDSKGAALMRLVSADRKALGKSSLAIDPSLVAIARNAPFTCPTKSSLSITGRARDMAVRSYFSHDIKGCRHSDGTAYRARENLAVIYGYTGSRSEIIHWNSAGTADTTYKVGCDSNGSNCKGGTITVSKTVATAQRNFMSSSTHRAVELSTTYDRFGCGSAKAPDSARVYYACLFTAGGPTVLAKPTPTRTRTDADPEADQRVLQREPADQGDDERHPQGDDRCRNDGPGRRHRHLRRQLQHRVRRQGRRRQELVQDRRINGKSVSSLYGVSAVYGAAGLFRPASSTTAALPSESIGTIGQTAADGGEVARRHADADTGSFPHPDTRRRPHPDARRRVRAPRPLPSPSPTPLIAKVYTLTSTVTFYGAATATASACRSTARVAAPARARATPRSSPTTSRARRWAAWPTRRSGCSCSTTSRRARPDPLTIYGRTGTFTIDGISKTFPKDARVRIYPTTSSGTTWKVVVTSAGGTTLHSGSIAKSFRIRPAQTSTRLQLYSRTSSYDRYRGVFRIVASTKVDVINELPLESYLRGVVPAEMPSHLARRGAEGTDGRGAVVRRAPPAAGCLDVRRL